MTEVTTNSKMQLSEHFSLGEFTKSNYPEVYNIPSHVAIENMKRICGWLEVLRKRYNDRYNSSTPGPIPEQSSPTRSLSSEGGEYPIIINSGYRNPQLNKKVGGVATSNHVTGCAVDIRCSGAEQAIEYAAILIEYSKEIKQDYDELFIEKNKYGRYWVHFAVRPRENRRKICFLNG